MGHLKALANNDFLSLVTYRDNGEAVATAIWVIELEGEPWIRTAKSTFTLADSEKIYIRLQLPTGPDTGCIK